MGHRIWLNWLKSAFRGPSHRPLKRRDVRMLRLERLEDRITPVSTLSVGNATFNLAAGAAGFTVTRSGDLTPAVDVGYSVTDGTALSGTNYTSTAPTGVLDFASGQTTATIPLSILTNNFAQATRTFSVDLTGVVATFGPPATFGAMRPFAVGTHPYSVTSADLNGDGKPDLIIANGGSNTVSVLLNTTVPGATLTSFSTQQTFAVGTHPFSVTVADINGDGKPDLIIANSQSAGGTVSVLLNTTATGATTASFATQQTFATGAGPVSVTTADINGDGKLDLLVANEGAGTVSVLLNTTAPGATTASFATQQTFAAGSAPRSITTADVNGDGLPDLLIADYGSASVSVLLNTTARGATIATFATAQGFATGQKPSSVAAADINGDGKQDLIVANYGSASVSVLLNTTTAGATTPSFATQTTVPTGTNSGPRSVAVTDVNGDGRPDIIVANYNPHTVLVLLNNTIVGSATATFTNGPTYVVGNGPFSVATADINGDGKPDILVANYTSGNVGVLLNSTSHAEASVAGVPTPDFVQTGTLSTDTRPIAVTVADINGDGKPDVLVANYGANTISVFLNTTAPGASTPTFALGQEFATGLIPVAVKVADVNGDGRPDLIVTNRSSGSVSVLVNETTPGATTLTFAAHQDFTTGGGPASVSIADLNGDGLADLIVANSTANDVSVLFNTTTPGATTVTFAAAANFIAGSGPQKVVAADVNGDGRPDLIVLNNTNSKTVSVLLNTTAPGATTPTFATQVAFATGNYPGDLAVADINGDGRPDIIVANYGGDTIGILLNTTAAGATTPTFAVQQTIAFAAANGPQSIVVADVNGDGLPDIVASTTGFSDGVVLLNKTAPGATAISFASPLVFPAGIVPFSLAVGDLNGDGLPDLVFADLNPNTVTVLVNTPAELAAEANSATGTIDSAPIVQSIARADANPTTAATVHFTVTFSEAVTGVTASNFVLTGTSGGAATIGTPTTTDGGITWTVPVTTNGEGTLGLNLNSRTGITDSVGNKLYDTTSDDGSVFNPIVGPLYTISATTSNTVTSSLNPSTYGGAVTFTATINSTNGGGAPTGSVEFFDGATDLGPGTTLAPSEASATSTFTISSLTAGAHTITDVYTATGNYVSSTSPNFTQNVNQAPLTITANNKNKVYGAALPTLTASYTGFVNNDTAANLTNQPSITTTANASSSVVGSPYSITASGAVDPNYVISYVAGNLTVTTAPLTITANPQTKAYGDPLPKLTVSYTGFVNSDTSANLTTEPSVTTTATAASPVAGSPYAITASGAADSNYTISYVAGSLTVTAVPLTITANDQTKVYGAALPTLTASYTGLVNGDTSASLTTRPTLTTTATAASTVSGSPYSITASGAVDSNYTISYDSGSLSVTTAPLTITANNLNKPVNAPVPPLTASYTGFVNGDTSSSLTTQPALSTTATSSSPIGTYPINVSGAADPNYAITYVAGTLTVGDLFDDNFNTGSTLSNLWTIRVGNYSTLTQTAVGTAIYDEATVNNINVSNVTVQATFGFTATAPQYVGLVARYSGPGDNNEYIGNLTWYGGTTYTATIYRIVNGTTTILMSANLSNFSSSTGTLRFDVEGQSLKLYVNNVLATYAQDSSLTTGTVGIRTLQGSSVDDFVANAIIVPVTTLTYGPDPFTATPPSNQLGSNWIERAGNFNVSTNTAVGQGPLNLAVLTNLSATNVAVQADLNFTANNQYVGLVARYSGIGDSNEYIGNVWRMGATNYAVTIYSIVNGATTALSTTVTLTSGTGTWLFDVQGPSLKLFLNNTLIAYAQDTKLTTGSVGIRGTSGASVDNFTASVLAVTNVTLPFSDSFDTPVNQQLSNSWTEQAGNYQLGNGNALGRSSINTAVLNGLSTASVTVQANVNLTTGGYFGLIADYNGAGDATAVGYLANVTRQNATTFLVSIYRNTGTGWTVVKQTTKNGFLGSIALIANGATLTMQLDSVPILTFTDTAPLSAGTVGMRSNLGASVSAFSASGPT